jgi:hypothetical protein
MKYERHRIAFDESGKEKLLNRRVSGEISLASRLDRQTDLYRMTNRQ